MPFQLLKQSLVFRMLTNPKSVDRVVRDQCWARDESSTSNVLICSPTRGNSATYFVPITTPDVQLISVSRAAFTTTIGQWASAARSWRFASW